MAEIELIPAPDEHAPTRPITIPSGAAGRTAGAAARSALTMLGARGRPGRMEYKSAPMAGGIDTIGQLIALGAAGIAAAATILAAWIATRNGRKVRVKKGDIEAEASNPDELREVLAILADVEPKPPAPLP